MNEAEIPKVEMVLLIEVNKKKKEMKFSLKKDKMEKKDMKVLAKKCIAKIKSCVLEQKKVMRKDDDLDIKVDSKYFLLFCYGDSFYGNKLQNSFYAIPKHVVLDDTGVDSSCSCSSTSTTCA